EVSRILRREEERAIELLSRHRGGLDAVARALLERETLDGSEVAQLVDTAYGRPVHEHTPTSVPQFAPSNGNHGPADVHAPQRTGDDESRNEESETVDAPAHTSAEASAQQEPIPSTIAPPDDRSAQR
ncbi:MAG TPA: hypothetical protein VEJ87_12860, partial [Acidimicrobiales bacterium]|nr:hypothetical protein [Acidimicrobiales bacterium]